MKIENAVIDKISLSTADHGVLSSFVTVRYGSGCFQGFGGYVLHNPKYEKSFAGMWLWRILEVTNKTEWNELPGTAVRVKIENGLIVALGNFMEDKWFEPRKEFGDETK